LLTILDKSSTEMAGDISFMFFIFSWYGNK